MMNTSKALYEAPVLDIVLFSTSDIVTTSVGGNEDDLPII